MYQGTVSRHRSLPTRVKTVSRIPSYIFFHHPSLIYTPQKGRPPLTHKEVVFALHIHASHKNHSSAAVPCNAKNRSNVCLATSGGLAS